MKKLHELQKLNKPIHGVELTQSITSCHDHSCGIIL